MKVVLEYNLPVQTKCLYQLVFGSDTSKLTSAQAVACIEVHWEAQNEVTEEISVTLSILSFSSSGGHRCGGLIL
jgi:hypothetical protein